MSDNFSYFLDFFISHKTDRVAGFKGIPKMEDWPIKARPERGITRVLSIDRQPVYERGVDIGRILEILGVVESLLNGTTLANIE